MSNPLYKISAKLPEEEPQRTQVRAGAYAMALTAARRDPEIKIRMALGEAYGGMRHLMFLLRDEAVREVAWRYIRDDFAALNQHIGDEKIAAIQGALLAIALTRTAAEERAPITVDDAPDSQS